MKSRVEIEEQLSNVVESIRIAELELAGEEWDEILHEQLDLLNHERGLLEWILS